MQLDKALQSQGGKTRANNQSDDERKFQAMIAASRRPLLNDAKLTPEEMVRAFRDLAGSRHWFRVVIVCADRSTIENTVNDDAEVLRLVKKGGGAIGFLGVTLLGESLVVFSKPLKRGVKVTEDLSTVRRKVLAEVQAKLVTQVRNL
jgi:flagella basal body P-ring formation protein FlgA